MRHHRSISVQQIHRQPVPCLACALGRNVDIGFKVLVLVHRRQRCSRRDVVALVDWDVAHNSVKRRANLVVGKLFALRPGLRHRRIQRRLGVGERLHRLVVRLLGGDAVLE